MKVLQINAVYGFASTGKIAKDIGDAAQKQGIASYVACQKSSLSGDHIYCVGNLIDWKLHAIFTRLTGKQTFYSKLPTKGLLRWLDGIHPDLVHLHNIHSNFVNLPLICDYCKKRDIPLVLTLHDCWFFTGKCTHFIKTRCDRWISGCGECSQLKQEVPCMLGDPTARNLQEKMDVLNSVPKLYVVGCSHWITDCARRSQLNAREYFTIQNGVDTGVFTPKESEFSKANNLENRFVILGMANKWADTENRQGVIKLLKGLNPDYRVIMVGCGEEENTLFAEYSNVITVPFVKDAEALADIYNAADVFVNLTRADTLPTVNMESICCGVPVITFDVCGSPELVDESCGAVVKEGDFDGVLATINKIAEQPASFDVAKMQKRFNKDVSYLQYVQLYKAMQ